MELWSPINVEWWIVDNSTCVVYKTKELKTDRNGTPANFFSYVCNLKKNKELFAFSLNGITASVRCVSSSILLVVLNAKLTRLIAAHANKKDSEKRKGPRRVPCFC